MSVIEIKNDELSVGINTFGSELMYIKSASGTDFLWNGDENVWAFRAPVMFPICGGLKEDKYIFDNKEYSLPKHGFAKLMEFEGKKVLANKAEFVLKSNEETMKKFPFEFVFKITFELSGNALKVDYAVENVSESDMYFSVGAHEGYYCPEGIEEYEVCFENNQTLNSYILNGNLLEDNYITVMENNKNFELKYDYFKVDALVFKNVNFDKATLVHKNSNKKVSVSFKGANYFLLWTKPGANYICLEPWHGVQDIVGSEYDFTKKEGIIRLNGGKTYIASHTIECFE